MGDKGTSFDVLHQVFPDLPPELLRTLLEAHGNNPQAAAAAIMSILEKANTQENTEEEEEAKKEPPLPPGQQSVVKPTDEFASKCNYCAEKKKEGRVSYGMEGRRLRVEHYQALIDRGWRRSGTWLYQPSNSHPDCCCKQHTIRLEAAPFKPNKSQKKVLKKIEKYLRGAPVNMDSSSSMDPDNDTTTTTTTTTTTKDTNDKKKKRLFFFSKDDDTDKKKTSFFAAKDDIMKTEHQHNEGVTKTRGGGEEKGKKKKKEEKPPVTGEQAELQEAVTKAVGTAVGTAKLVFSNLPGDAKFPILVTATPKKMKERGNYSTNVGIIIAGILSKLEPDKKKRSNHSEITQSICKAIVEHIPPRFSPSVSDDGFINFHTKSSITTSTTITSTQSKPPHTKRSPRNTTTATTTTAPASLLEATQKEKRESETSEATTPHKLTIKMIRAEYSTESYELYCKYQIAVHHDKPEKLTPESYTRFLVTSSLIDDVSSKSANPAVNSGFEGYGSFHMHYRLDGKLVAVGVVDVLPDCLSSVYFYYDPSYAFLSLGVYSALKEIEWVNNITKYLPNIKYYYMGFYINTCPKMKYKGEYHPSYLLCPSTYTWVPLPDALQYITANDDKNDKAGGGKNDGEGKAKKRKEEDGGGVNSNDDVTMKVGNRARFNWTPGSDVLVENITGEAALAIIPKIPIWYQSRFLNYNDFQRGGRDFLRPRMTKYLRRVGEALAMQMVYDVR